MKRTRAHNPKLEDPAVVKPQRRINKHPKPCANNTAPTDPSAMAAAAADAGAVVSVRPEVAPSVPDVCAGGGDETAVEWDIDGGLDAGSWWTFGVEEEKLLGWFPFVEEDFRCVGSGRGDADNTAAFDDDIWRIHQIYEIPSYAAK